MPETGTAPYAAFVALHQDRLVCSLVSESRLSLAAAETLAAEVLPTAFDRRLPTCGAAYGWLRVAARHLAAGDPAWAAAADAALSHADLARSALSALPADDRALLRLRYVDGLLPATLAERLGVTVPEVVARLERVTAAARCAPVPRAVAPAAAPPVARRPLAVPLPRAAAALAAAAAAVVLSVGVTPRVAAPVATSPWVPGIDNVIAPEGVAAEAPAPASDRAPRTVALAAAPVAVAAAVRPPAGRAPVRPPGGGCTRDCGGGGRLFDELHVDVPEQVANPTGRREVVVPQEAGYEYVRLCEALGPVPKQVARCERGEH